MTLRFVVPALNECANLPRLLERLETAVAAAGLTASLTLVDDGSTDGTAEVATAHRGRLEVAVVRHAVNRGPGAAFLTGFQAVATRHRPGDVWCTLEADNTSDLAILPAMLAHIGRGAHIVLASVYAPGGGIRGLGPGRHALSVAANGLMRAVFGLWRIHTFSSFYRVYRGDVLVRALETWGDDLLREPGFTCMAELLLKLARLGARIEEVPMILDSSQRIGASRMRVGKNLRDHGRLFARWVSTGGFAPPRGRPAVRSSAQSTSAPRSRESRTT